MNWYELAKARQQELLDELTALLKIESVLDESITSKEHPFGPGPREALDFMLRLGEEQGLKVKNIDNMAGHIEMGEGDEALGILCHVDVVPAGDLSTWTYPPFEGRIVDGKLYARGSIDDKGPTMAAWMAMKLVKDAGIKLNKRVRMIIGTDEESGFRCVTRYFEKEEMPEIGFAPDADFPLINAEKGIANLVFSQNDKPTTDEKLISFKAGKRINMVPDLAEAVMTNIDGTFVENFQSYLAKNGVEGSFTNEGNNIIITVKGKSAHAMEPEKGVNAAVLLAQFLKQQQIGGAGQTFAEFMDFAFGQNPYGESMSLSYTDDMSGPTTLNAGLVSFGENGGEIRVSMRYSVTYPFEEKITAAQPIVAAERFSLDVADNDTPHYVPENDVLVATLLDVYRGATGDMRAPLSTGGGTYARVMKKGVAFGMLYPGELELAHQADEFVDIENLVKATAIYAEAIVKLASK